MGSILIQRAEDIQEPANKRQRLDYGDNQYLRDGDSLIQGFEDPNGFSLMSHDQGSMEGIWTDFLQTSEATTMAFPLDGSNFNDCQNSSMGSMDMIAATSGEVDYHYHWSNESYGEENRVVFQNPVVETQINTEEPILPEIDQPIDQPLCFGMISDVPITSTQSSMMTLNTSAIALSFRRPKELIEIGKDHVFAELDDRNAKILANLSAQDGIEFQISCRTINRRAASTKKGGRKPGVNDLQYVMNCIIYGPKDLCDPVGSYLTQIGIFLQDPLNCDRDVVYSNPHIIPRTDEVVMTSSIQLSSSVPEVEMAISQEDLFAELSSDAHLSLTDAPEAIKTPLYNHQKKALTFMKKKEDGWHYDDGALDDLWVKEVDETGQVIYTNTITEISQKKPPDESKGGLLADNMGLGKSLTMISLIALNTCKISDPYIFNSDGNFRRLKSTLVVVPYSLLETWNVQLKRHLHPNTLSWTRFHGSQTRNTLSLGSYDIVITTFETLVRQQKKHLDPPKKVKEDTLFSFFWHRIVLDEAHTIRNRATAMARAARTIQATSRWAITGTPIQNRVADFSSLLEFLKIYPFSNPKTFDTEIVKPWLKSPEKDVSRMKKLVNCVSLCRTKAIIDLPKREDLIHNLDFSPEEQEFYENAKAGTIRRLDIALSSNPLLPGEYLNALQWLNELRLICNHGLTHSKRDPNKVLSTKAQDTQIWNRTTANKAFETMACGGEAICSVCKNILIDGAGGPNSDTAKPHLAKCLTLTCGSCIKDSLRGHRVPTCPCTPLCKSVEVTWSPEGGVQTGNPKTLPDIPPEQVSTKLRTLLKDLQECPEGEKSVVFSYWTFTLDLIESLLRKAGITYTRIDGQHSGERREEAIQKFQTDETVQVILVSITCGGAGLDLTAASVAYLLEPQWNPMMEEQALCRIHRLGQEKEVKTIRYRIRGSFEEKVVAVQDLKKEIAAEAFAPERRRNPLNNATRLQYLRDQLT